MKICQEQKEKKQLKFNKKLLCILNNGSIILKIVLCCLVFCLVFSVNFTLFSCKVNAQGAADIAAKLNKLQAALDDPTKIKVIDKAAIEMEMDLLYAQLTQDKAKWSWEQAWEEFKENYKEYLGAAYKAALGNFLNQFAYDTATYLATGDEGQKPMFITEGWGAYLSNTADTAAGYFIQELGQQGFGGMKYNLCEPDFGVKLKIVLGLQRWHKPKPPACTFTEMIDNWEEELKDPDFLSKFQDMFNPWSNDLGIALSLQTQLGAEVDKKASEAKDEAIKNQGWKDVKQEISGYIKSPSALVGMQADAILKEQGVKEKTYTGTVADAIDIFINTLAGRLLEEWLRKGLVTEFDEYQPWEYDDLADYESQVASGGIAGAKERFRKLIEPNFAVRGDYDILGELVMCPDPTKAGPTNCVITDNFRQAIINRMTVGQAMDQGYLNANGIFGFTADGLEPDYYDEGYPYRSMIILRKFRIIPVGWELAAQYIQDFSNETLNLSDLVACYDPSDDWDGYSETWCLGLVDPNWVLKAPLNYCKREGPGPEIISEQVIGEGYDSELAISRNDNYCADEQSCIQENDDGSCQLYGYCTEERRKWQFNGTNCEPRYNTCQTFRSRTGNTASYLENTLDYKYCTADNVGCQPYCADYNFATGNWNCTLASVNDKLYADKDIEECDQNEEGCHEFIRTKAGLGANFLRNSSFEEFTGAVDDGAVDDFADWGIIGEAVSGSYDGLIGLQLLAALNRTVDVASTTHSVAGEIFSLSFYAKNCTIGDDFGIEADAVSLNDGSNWQYYQTIYIYPATASGNQVNFTINTASCIIDAIELERGITATAYSDYRGNGLVYQKLAPDYLGCTGAASDPDECDNFVRECNQSEVGCELYTSVTDDMSIPAKVTAQDYCAAECVGYDTYIQQETIFDSLRDAYFIPSAAQVCGAESAGCDEFTNLDEVARGGEGIEYYSYLRQCIKPSDPAADCAEFYTWEGSDETGFQLRLHSLEEDLIGADGILNDPDVTSDDSLECNAAIYALPATDPGYNSDCREFYNDSGEISYHLYTRTISCDEDCHPFRRTENNIDPNLDVGSCLAGGDGSSKYIGTINDQFEWDTTYEVCYFCKSRGEWSDDHQACIYMAVTGEGVGCSAGQNGCREYIGNVGNNMRIVLNNDFEGSSQGWLGIDGATVELSSTALMAGGESLWVHDANFKASTTVGSLVQKDKSYVLSFLAQSAGASEISAIKLVNGAGGEVDFITDPLIIGGWQLYKVNLTALNHDVSDSESLVIEADGDFYIDDIRLTEITDRWYLIKNSWVTPDSCYEDILGNYVGPIYNLGCDEYYDRDNDTHFLHSFSRLCQESAVGCETMIDTDNYSDYKAEGWNDGGDDDCAGDGDDCVVVEADSFIYVVYDKDKKCNSRDKGCQRLGNPYQYASDVLYSDIYLKNNPDQYDSILCLVNEVGCEQWTTTEGTDYFKDPGDQVCEWQQAAGVAQGSWGWYKKKIKRCDTDNDGIGDGNVCLIDNNCDQTASPAETCALESADNACTTDTYKTLGKGGAGNMIEQPTWDGDGYWAGLCPASQAGCTEYVDPVSRFSANMLYNADFSQDVDSDGLADGWDAIVNGTQNIVLETRTLYILAVKDNNTATVGATNNDFYELDSNNQLIGPVNAIAVISVAGSRASKHFYTSVEVSANITVNDASKSNGSKVELKKAIIDYQLKQDLDKTTCNGIVNFEDGCVLFNQRSQNGIGLAGLDWDADLTVNDGAGVTPDAGLAAERDANTLLKATPDRVCNKWLACRSFIKDENDNNVCFDIGLCDSVDDNGNCDNFVITNQINQTHPSPVSAELAGNMSGYVKAGYDNSSLKADYYPLGAMEQKGEVANVPNNGFEWTGSNGYPIGWTWAGGTWDKNVFSVIDNPYQAQEEGIGYAPVGRSFLKLGSTYHAVSEWIDVVGGVPYILTAYINTINLSDGTARLQVNQYNSSGILIQTDNDVVTLGSGNKWTYKLGSFDTHGSAVRVEVMLHSNSITVGNFYFDDVKLRPALNSRSINPNKYTPQTCRLYPKDDALSCDYYEDSGKRQKGWLGYCLEYDRYPGSDDACLLWWPVDKVKGEGIEEGAGYLGKMPVHYCVEAEALVMLEYRASPGWLDCTGYDDNWSNLYVNCPTVGYAIGSFGGTGTWGWHTCVPAGTCYLDCVNNTGNTMSVVNNHGWYEFDGSFAVIDKTLGDQNGGCADINGVHREADYGIKFYDPNTGKIFDDLFAYCTKVVQTVNSVGSNKYWSGRVYEGSDYKVPGLEYGYNIDYPPFGAIIEPFPVNNPYEWDGSDNDGIQPLYVTKKGVRASHPYKINNISVGTLGICRNSKDVCLHLGGVSPGLNKADCPVGDICDIVDFSGDPISKIKRLFVQSYGTWQWNGSHYVKTAGDWTPPTNLCNGTGLLPRPAYPNDWCGIKPKVFNIMVNSQDNNVTIGKNQFINLTFNSDVDAEQLPLVMYALDWGDNEWTVVTGVEMRDRPNLDNPHSLYHLYSYWDLKAKHSVDQDDLSTAENENTIYCGVAGDATAWNYNDTNSIILPDAPSDNYCAVQPKVKIKDNWGWCNNGGNPLGDPCPAGGYHAFNNGNSWIIVKNALGMAVCIPDGCNNNCPVGCTVAADPDCGAGGCCGDGSCYTATECSSCAADCAVADCCGNGNCDAVVGETIITCPADCQCGDGFCDTLIGEDDPLDPDYCPTDCLGMCTADGCNGICPINCIDADDSDCNAAGCCGDGKTVSPNFEGIFETCDDGAGNTDIPCVPSYGSNCAYCDTSCASHVIPMTEWCGDWTIQDPPEQCDDGKDGDDTNQCNDTCFFTYCGDGTLQTPNGVGWGGLLNDGNEQCDDGAANDDATSDANCRSTCRNAYCGDKVVDTGEVCDNGSQCDDLTTDCTLNPGVCGAGTCAPRDGDGCAADCSGP